jgi:hypothetical protein
MRVIMDCRDDAKAAAARDSIVDTTGNKSIETAHLDLASLESIGGFSGSEYPLPIHAAYLAPSDGRFFRPGSFLS